MVPESDAPPPDWESLGVAAALLSRYQQDQHALLEQLATFMESALPRQTSVKRTLGVIGPRRATSLHVELGGNRYVLEREPRAGLQASRTRVVRSVAVRTDPISVEAWLQEISAALEAQLANTTGGRAALTQLLNP